MPVVKGFETLENLPQEKISFVADEIARMNVTAPRPAGAEDVRTLLSAAY